ncbi:adenylyltransferase/cytidyltransferase family protein [Candidatus Woesearchaeota archaeon]|nr:adenylyltransferase/cytidyltransferase family protein [Candidatus Woesearchaeota archaeon]
MKIITYEDIEHIRMNKKLVTTNGSFDILHVGHLRILQQAKALGDVLLVLVNSDSSVKENKSDKRPIISEKERMEMLAGLACVDYVLIFDEKKALDPLRKIKPDVHVKGGTYIPERIQEEKDLVESWGGKHICLGEIAGYSTTNIIEKIREVYK